MEWILGRTSPLVCSLTLLVVVFFLALCLSLLYVAVEASAMPISIDPNVYSAFLPALVVLHQNVIENMTKIITEEHCISNKCNVALSVFDVHEALVNVVVRDVIRIINQELRFEISWPKV
jgi:hypothetical protein